MREAREGLGRVDLAALGVAYFTIGVTVSVAVVGIGTPGWLTLLVALTAYSATSELAFVAVAGAGGSLLSGLVAGWLVATRFGILAVSLGSRLPGSRVQRALAALTTVDPSVALALTRESPADVRRTYWRVTIVLLVGWLAGSAVGVAVGNVLGDPRAWGLDAVFPAALVAIVARLLARRDGLFAALGGGAVCLLLIPHVPGGVPIVAAAAAAFLALRVAPRPWGAGRG